MSEPLILPLVAIVSGILLGRGLAFSALDALWPVAAFSILAALSKNRLRQACVALALVFGGVFAEAWHRPGPKPEIDAGSRETVLIQGCVVEPSVLAPNREQFTLELDRGARARVSLRIDDDGDRKSVV